MAKVSGSSRVQGQVHFFNVFFIVTYAPALYFYLQTEVPPTLRTILIVSCYQARILTQSGELQNLSHLPIPR